MGVGGEREGDWIKEEKKKGNTSGFTFCQTDRRGWPLRGRKREAYVRKGHDP